jgi:hypothetical protein
MQVDTEPSAAPVDEFVFSVRARSDGACVVRGRAPGFEFEGCAPVFVESQAWAERWRAWVMEACRG